VRFEPLVSPPAKPRHCNQRITRLDLVIIPVGGFDGIGQYL